MHCLIQEELLKDGQLVLLPLAPVAPRSLMQGDYMSLRYAISAELDTDTISKRGYCVVRLESNGVASRVRFQKAPLPGHSGEQLIGYTAPDNWNVNIGAESFLFEEGQAEKYDGAKYGALRVDKNGNSLLVGLYDEGKRKIE
ncbi:GDYXXLXY domain-containing protein [Niabella yanshanensis]|uniref:GDYXXLXY domain-containing protein n=1 Tax=Niabella yanshanensis TaxID=577386 RepID=A0ABZ0WBN6_9BACT|nr:GDYXXLXY domain-containing protein [Niabella yanshanensis]WQD40626.1 GDYXXLXY domain-containing protein [Niabella yanshanensis]